jgi:hypothetical protein
VCVCLNKHSLTHSQKFPSVRSPMQPVKSAVIVGGNNSGGNNAVIDHSIIDSAGNRPPQNEYPAWVANQAGSPSSLP